MAGAIGTQDIGMSSDTDLGVLWRWLPERGRTEQESAAVPCGKHGFDPIGMK
jgi:hypothetical protein